MGVRSTIFVDDNCNRLVDTVQELAYDLIDHELEKGEYEFAVNRLINVLKPVVDRLNLDKEIVGDKEQELDRLIGMLQSIKAETNAPKAAKVDDGNTSEIKQEKDPTREPLATNLEAKFKARGDLAVLKRRAQRAEEKLLEAAKPNAPSAKLAPIVIEALEQEAAEEKQEVGFNARLLVQATLPHRKPPPGVSQFQRSNGFITITINGRQEYGLPYGTYPRLLLAWVTTEAVKTGSPELKLGNSLAAFMGKLGLPTGGGPRGTYTRVRDHMTRLFTSVISATIERDNELHNLLLAPVEKFSLFWDPKRPEQEALWQSTLRLSPLFFEEITRKPVPIDMGALRELAKGRSPMALDIYQWLTYRMTWVKQPVRIPWPRLQLQFGCDYGATRYFKRAFLSHLKRVLEVYPQANMSIERDYLKLLPSKTHVPKLKGRR